MDPNVERLQDIFRLSSYEAHLYIAGLSFAKAHVTMLSKKSGIPRTAIYPPLRGLLKRGLMSRVRVGKRNYYRSLPPAQLLSLLEYNKTALAESAPKLKKSRADTDPNRFSTEYFKGTNGLLAAIQIFLHATRDGVWRTFENPLFVTPFIGEHRLDKYISDRVEKGITTRTILPGNLGSEWISDHLKKDKEELRETLNIATSEYPIEAVIGVNESMVILVMTNDEPFTVLIRSKPLAHTLSSIHDMVWDRYKK